MILTTLMTLLLNYFDSHDFTGDSHDFTGDHYDSTSDSHNSHYNTNAFMNSHSSTGDSHDSLMCCVIHDSHNY